MSPEGAKIPHRPERLVGAWAVSLGHELFRITSAEGTDQGPLYVGRGLHEQIVTTHVPTVLTQADQKWLEERR